MFESPDLCLKSFGTFEKHPSVKFHGVTWCQLKEKKRTKKVIIQRAQTPSAQSETDMRIAKSRKTRASSYQAVECKCSAVVNYF